MLNTLFIIKLSMELGNRPILYFGDLEKHNDITITRGDLEFVIIWFITMQNHTMPTVQGQC